MKKAAILFLLIFISMNLNAQQWSKNFGDTDEEKIKSLVTDDAGNYYISGCYKSAKLDFGNGKVLTNSGSYDGYFAKFDPSGNCLLAVNIGNTKNEYINDLKIDNSGNLYVCGYYLSASIDFGNNSKVSNIAGADAFLAKYSPDGVCLWAVNVGSWDYDYALKIAINSQNDIYLSGEYSSSFLILGNDTILNTASNSFYRSSDAYILKFDNNGNFKKNYAIVSGANFEWLKDFAIDKNDNLLLCGGFTSSKLSYISYNPDTKKKDTAYLTNTSASGYYDGYLIKCNSMLKYDNGIVVSGIANDIISSLSQDQDGNIFITGYFKSTDLNFPNDVKIINSTGSDYNAFIAKFNSSWLCQWAYNLGGTNYDFSNVVRTDSKGNAIIAGSYSSSKFYPGDSLVLHNIGNEDGLIAKYNTNGKCLWTYNIGSINSEVANVLFIDKNDNAISAGYFTSPTLNVGTYQMTNTGSSDVYIVNWGNNTELNLINPENDAVKDKIIKFKWNKTSGAEQYILQVLDLEPTPHFIINETVEDSTYAYTFADNRFYYWRTIAVSGNDTIAISELRKFQVNELAVDDELESMSIYPNPASDYLNISFGTQDFGAKSIIIYNQLGEIVDEYLMDSFETANRINIESLNSGSYFICIISGTNRNYYPIQIIH